jgi:HopJ type III effector protein
MKLIDLLATSPNTIEFNQVISHIDSSYHFTPTAFQNGDTYNAANQNNGSCKIFSFANLLKLTKEQTLQLFGDYYRKDVLQNLEGTDHQNIRNFMKFGWDGIKFEGEALTEK